MQVIRAKDSDYGTKPETSALSRKNVFSARKQVGLRVKSK
jgi:hypothetical protein